MNHPRLMLLFAILFTISAYIYQVIPFCIAHEKTCFAAIDNPSPEPVAPGAYRILAPALLNLSGYDGTKAGQLFAGFKLHIVLITAVFVVFYHWMKRWTMNTSMAIVLLALALSLAFQFYLYDPGSLLETLLFMLTALFYRRFGICCLLVVISATNRETAIFMPLIYFALNGGKAKNTVVLLLIYAAVVTGIHLVIGPAEHMLGNIFTGTWAYNVGTFSEGLVVNLVLLPLWIMVGVNYDKASPLQRHLTWIAVMYGGAILVGAAWNEAARLILPIFPLVTPIIFQEQTT